MNKSVSDFARLGNWWKYTAAPLLGVVYFLLYCFGFTPHESLRIVVRLFISIAGFASLGYFLNDWADVKQDEKAGKKNKLSSLGLPLRILLLTFFTIIAFAPWVFFGHFIYSLSLIGIEIFLLFAYSFPPFRWKVKPFVAPVIDALYSHVIPPVLFAGVLFLINQQKIDFIFIGLLILWKLFSGIRYYLNHIALDRENDLASEHTTLATLKGNNYIFRNINTFILPAEFVFLLSVFLYAGFYLNSGAFIFIPFAMVTFFVEQIITLSLKYVYSFRRIFLDDFYQRVFPLLCTVLLSWQHEMFVLLLIAQLILFHRAVQRIFWVFKMLYRAIDRIRFLRFVSMLANYSVYYFRKYVLQYNEEKARKGQYPEYLKQQSAFAEKKRKSDIGRIAVININKRKYTETFINKLIDKLPFEVHYLYGGELPWYYNEGTPLLTNNEWQLKRLSFLQTLFKRPNDYFLKQAIIHYLTKNKIQLILAEFGPAGVKMLDISKETGIPLIVNFHGYDVCHMKIREDLGEEYKRLFKECAALIAVSKEMKQTLIEMGADKNKIVYQPAFVDLNLFKCNDVSKNPPVFLSVGRFSETKSPHLTILAFEKVLQKIPHAKLVLIGKDGGGDLFEACKILVKAWGVELQVEFKGVLSPEEVYEEMKKARVFVQHSVTTPLNGDKEGTPVAIMEASAAGLPIVATKHGGIPDVVIDGKTGILVGEYDVEAMTDAMLKLATDNQLVFEMGKAGSENILGNSLIANYVENLSGLIKKFLV